MDDSALASFSCGLVLDSRLGINELLFLLTASALIDALVVVNSAT